VSAAEVHGVTYNERHKCLAIVRANGQAVVGVRSVFADDQLG